ncbi:hypothetical protein STCU_10409 [Strigomonas culicis]|uniref:Uncharacterized protein n=1 Tax=Strigomonas culicis TaxID=28005 RepID=S9TLU4_9TRYP|nr:hypothetical protein STCU_10409 [Strigomonas culicis]|eukprot:EPY17774.1 hypothetical protein STCU_10409 [Strigomonas culicis]
MGQLPLSSSAVARRCLEQLVLLAAHTVVEGGGRARGVARKADPATAPKLKEQTAADVQLVWLRALALVATTYAAQHAQTTKHTAAEQELPQTACDNAVFLQCAIVRRLRRVVAAAAAAAAALNADEALAAAFARLAPAEQAAVRIVLAPAWAPPAAPDAVVSLIKAKPGALGALLGGRRAVAGALVVTAPADLLQHTLYNMGLTNVTPEMYLDYVAVLRALPAEALLSYFAATGKDAVVALFAPFVTHARVLTAALAPAR